MKLTYISVPYLPLYCDIAGLRKMAQNDIASVSEYLAKNTFEDTTLKGKLNFLVRERNA